MEESKEGQGLTDSMLILMVGLVGNQPEFGAGVTRNQGPANVMSGHCCRVGLAGHNFDFIKARLVDDPATIWYRP